MKPKNQKRKEANERNEKLLAYWRNEYVTRVSPDSKKSALYHVEEKERIIENTRRNLGG